MDNNIHRSTAEVHELGESYSRFDQKNNFLMQSHWKEKIKELDTLRKNNLQKLINKERQGYSRYDYAYYHGAISFIEKIEFGINFPDQRGNSWDNQIPENATIDSNEDPVEATKVVKKAAAMYGAGASGITKLDRNWVYSRWYDPVKKESFPIAFSDDAPEYGDISKPTLLADGTRVIPKSMDTVIVLLFEMDYERLRYSPTLLAYGETIKVYADMSKTIMNMAGFINALGYNVIPSINCTALNVPLAIDAGLGQIGRHGKLISPELGSRTRIAKIITDMPLIPDKTIDFGVTEFCDTCRKCARDCPVNAIAEFGRATEAIDEAGNSHYLRWLIDHKKCYQHWSECGTNCNICLYVCPYNRGYKWTKNVIDLSNEREGASSSLIDSLEDMYTLEGLSSRSYKYWDKE